ncbi:hypothetical protein ncot_00060 [Nocardioides sp. JQ2195]|uniref:hypothetical protein n=1 Tax=Nocardioides sp. JQ2195 TaxID=2592334 RepID=UPI00143EDF9E|nr:hypothetical protein [Nocardioides sp. JQ2195]QIX25155.1 hypothetical protein ncot_00060 [Nocardioides sp. JQ2195]
MRPTRAVAVLLAVGLALSGCGGNDESKKDRAEPTPTAIPKDLQLPESSPVHDPRRVLALVPADAEVLTLTDYDEIRERLGYPDLTSDDLMTDRTAFWERADKDAVMLTDGLLRDQHSRLWLDYGFTQDDVDWEARFTGPDGSGYVLGFRPDQDMGEVVKAVKDDVAPLEDATVLAEQHLVVSGIADEGDPVWASDPTLMDLPAVGAESSYVHRGCIPVNEALGPDADFEDQDALTSKYDVRGLMPLDAFSVNFDDATATARTDRDRADLLARKDLIDVWPEVGSITWQDGFEGMPVADPSSGRIGWRVRNPVAAANLVLTDHLPFAVCNEMVPLDEPTGL